MSENPCPFLAVFPGHCSGKIRFAAAGPRGTRSDTPGPVDADGPHRPCSGPRQAPGGNLCVPLVPKFCFCRLPQLAGTFAGCAICSLFLAYGILNVWPLAPVSPIIRFRQYSLPGNWAWKSALWPFGQCFPGNTDPGLLRPPGRIYRAARDYHMEAARLPWTQY